MEILLTVTLFVIITGVLVIYNAFAWGYVASVIYGWFLQTQFSVLPDMQWWQFAGIMFLINCFVHNGNYVFKNELKDTKNTVVGGLLGPWMTLFAAWLFNVIIFQ